MSAAQEIAARAKSQIGVPFRLHGRVPVHALDCVGLAAFAVFGEDGLRSIPTGYTLRGLHENWLLSELDSRGLREISREYEYVGGDLLIFRPAARQLHLGIAAASGVVHAHAGLKKITFTPTPYPWPVIGAWRLIGE